MGNFHPVKTNVDQGEAPEKTNVDRGEAEVDIGF